MPFLRRRSVHTNTVRRNKKTNEHLTIIFFNNKSKFQYSECRLQTNRSNWISKTSGGTLTSRWWTSCWLEEHDCFKSKLLFERFSQETLTKKSLLSQETLTKRLLQVAKHTMQKRESKGTVRHVTINHPATILNFLIQIQKIDWIFCAACHKLIDKTWIVSTRTKTLAKVTRC